MRRRLIWTFLAFGIGAGSTFYYNAAVFGFLLAPAGDNLSPFDGQPVFSSPVDMMGATISLAIRGGTVLALPVLVTGILTLLKPWIRTRYWWFLTIFTVLTVVSFLTGAAFVYYVMLPVSLEFLLSFGEGVAVPVILLDKYIELTSSLMLWVGLVFELPIAMYLLVKFRIISYQKLRRFRKFVPPTAIILAGIITPTFDGYTQIMVALPMWLLYEMGLFTSWLAHPSEGNYLWLRTIGRWLRKVRDGLAWVLRKVRIVARSPVVMVRWIYRKVLRKE
jgi:sec-independent protein translocase protein TatC